MKLSPPPPPYGIPQHSHLVSSDPPVERDSQLLALKSPLDCSIFWGMEI